MKYYFGCSRIQGIAWLNTSHGCAKGDWVVGKRAQYLTTEPWCHKGAYSLFMSHTNCIRSTPFQPYYNNHVCLFELNFET
jgi:hypothetical protein